MDEQQSDTIARLQAYLRRAAQQGAEVITVPPFTLCLPLDGGDEEAIAIPATPLGEDPRGTLPALQATAARAGRGLRFAFLAEFAPGLALALLASGYAERSRRPLLTCTPETLRPAPAVQDLTIVTLDARSPLADVREGLDANERGFNPGAAPITDAATEAFRRELINNRAFTARLDTLPVGAGMFTPPHEGVAELVGITTLVPYRRRGIAAALTTHATRTAFALGVALAFLSASDPAGRRIYERLGFRMCAHNLTFGSLPDHRGG